jgi:hypothetical protein
VERSLVGVAAEVVAQVALLLEKLSTAFESAIVNNGFLSSVSEVDDLTPVSWHAKILLHVTMCYSQAARRVAVTILVLPQLQGIQLYPSLWIT